MQQVVGNWSTCACLLLSVISKLERRSARTRSTKVKLLIIHEFMIHHVQAFILTYAYASIKDRWRK
jgi:hypothetical protein